MKLLGDRILLKVSREKKVGSLYIPDTVTEVVNVGMIVQLGSDLKSREFEVDQIVMFDIYAAQRVKIDDEEFFIVHSADISMIM